MARARTRRPGANRLVQLLFSNDATLSELAQAEGLTRSEVHGLLRHAAGERHRGLVDRLEEAEAGCESLTQQFQLQLGAILVQDRSAAGGNDPHLEHGARLTEELFAAHRMRHEFRLALAVAMGQGTGAVGKGTPLRKGRMGRPARSRGDSGTAGNLRS